MIKLLLLYTLSTIGEYHSQCTFWNKQQQLVGNSVLLEGNLVMTIRVRDYQTQRRRRIRRLYCEYISTHIESVIDQYLVSNVVVIVLLGLRRNKGINKSGEHILAVIRTDNPASMVALAIDRLKAPNLYKHGVSIRYHVRHNKKKVDILAQPSNSNPNSPRNSVAKDHPHPPQTLHLQGQQGTPQPQCHPP